MDSKGSRVLERAAAPNSAATDLRRQRATSSERAKHAQYVLRVGDGIAIFIGYAVPLLLVASYGPRSPWTALFEAALLSVVGLWSMRLNGLWTA